MTTSCRFCLKEPIYLEVTIPSELSYTNENRTDRKPIDRCISSLVTKLNSEGVLTSGACCGHGDSEGEIILHDGTVIRLDKQTTRYEYETCDSCGIKVFDSTGEGSYWLAKSDLWFEVYGTTAGIKCISCFTKDAINKGLHVFYEAKTVASSNKEFYDCKECLDD